MFDNFEQQHVPLSGNVHV